MTGLILVGLVPFAALGILLGHMLTPDSIGPAMGGGDLAAGAPRRHLVPDHRNGFLHDIAQLLPVLLARAGQPRRARRARLAGEGLDRDRRLDGRAERARRRAPTGATPGACSSVWRGR